MRQWILDAEHILSGRCIQVGETVSNANISQHFDTWRTSLTARLTDGILSSVEMECLAPCLQLLTNLRPYLIQCYDREEFPRTNNDTEREIRGIKTNYRRISGRKNWNNYLLRYGRCVVFSAWWHQEPERPRQLEQYLKEVTPEHWRRVRKETQVVQSEQLKRFRFRRKRTAYLASLETRWASSAQSVLLP
ncbi:MAG: hypothetical protein NVS4B11_23410 [Ktedonobacteraceae bacterium]